MGKFKTGDYVYFNDYQMAGEVVEDNNDGTYTIEWDEGSNSGRMTVLETEMEIGEKPDYRIIPEMSIKEYDERAYVVLMEMRGQYKSMSMGDIQTVLMFSKMFKEKYIEEQR